MATLNDLIERGTAFFSGETVSKAELERAKADLATANLLCAEHLSGLESIRTKLTQTESDLTTSKQTIATLTAQSSAKDTELSALKDASKTVAQTATELVAAQGIPAAQAPASQAGATGTEEAARAAALKQYTDLSAAGKSLEAGQFYEANKKLIRGW